MECESATEINNAYFSVERCSNARDFTEIGQLEGAGNSFLPQEYIYSDQHPLQGKNYYRLRQVDFDGKFSYSPIVIVTFGNAKKMVLAPQPTSDNLHILLENPMPEDCLWQVFDMTGRLMLAGEIPGETTVQSLNIAELPEGVYVFRLTVGQDVMVERFRKIK